MIYRTFLSKKLKWEIKYVSKITLLLLRMKMTPEKIQNLLHFLFSIYSTIGIVSSFRFFIEKQVSMNLLSRICYHTENKYKYKSTSANSTKMMRWIFLDNKVDTCPRGEKRDSIYFKKFSKYEGSAHSRSLAFFPLYMFISDQLFVRD
jgi:hypothetical protein